MNEVLCALLGLVVGFWFGLRLGSQAQPFDAIESTVATDISPVPASDGKFAVAGHPRKLTWRERRRELEAKERTKRQKLEQWRD